jgi:hypothetical protein
VGSVVDLGEVLEIKVRIDLRRRDIGVTQQFLHPAQVLARLEQMRRERMAEQVRVNVPAQTLAARPARDALLDRTGSEPRTATAHEQSLLAACRER